MIMIVNAVTLITLVIIQSIALCFACAAGRCSKDNAGKSLGYWIIAVLLMTCSWFLAADNIV